VFRPLRCAACLGAAFLALPVVTAQDKPPLRWGTDPTGGAPYIYQDNDGKFVGFEVELAQFLADKLGRTSVPVKGDWDKLPELLDKKEIDVVFNGYELREDLVKKYAVTRPYYVYRLQLVAHKDDDSIEAWSDLPARAGRKGKSVGVLNGTVAHEYLKDTFGDKIDLKINPDVATVMGLVKDRRLDATVQDGPAAAYFAKEMPQLRPVDEGRKPGFYVIYLAKSDPALLDQLNAAIRDGITSGKFEAIYRKYGIWNDDQERLSHWLDRPWPPFEPAAGPAEDGGRPKVNPWPRMIRELLSAAGMTVFLAVTAFPLAILLGLLVAVGRVYGPGWLAALLGVYVEVLRGTPLLLQLYTIYYLIPKILPGLDLTELQAGIFGLAINYSAYEAENYRAGLLAIPRGQTEAALSLGMPKWTAIRHVVVPQAVRVVIPPVTNDFIALFKDTSVCSVILITELTRKYNELYNFNRDYIVELAAVTAGLYLLMSYPLALAARYLERRLGTGHHGAKP
jgi:polar amino acid transport system substrate-binding protein